MNDFSVVLTNASAKDRRFSDFYPTPRDVTIALLDFLYLPRETRVWEPAAGEGHMVDVLRERFDTVIEGDIQRGQDFLKIGRYDQVADWIITNPPFSESEDFIRHAAEMDVRGFAFLLKSQYWHASSRLELFRKYPPSAVLPLTWRPDFLFGKKGGAPTMEVVWTVWDHSELGDPTRYIPLARPTV